MLTISEIFLITITLKQTDDGRVIRIQSHPKKEGEQDEGETGEPTSQEPAVKVEIMKDTDVQVSGTRQRQSSQNVVGIGAETAGQIARLVSITKAGRPTQGDGSNASTANQAKIEVEQTGLINAQTGIINVSLAIGNIFFIHVSS